MDNKKYEPIVYEYYKYLRKNHYGKENGIERSKLAEHFKLKLTAQKNILKTINESAEFSKLVSTSGSIYMCRTKAECEKAAFNEFKSGLTRLKKGKQMLNKINMNGQMKIKLGEYYKETIECFEVKI